MLINRRQFLKGSAVVVPAATVMPAVFSRAVAASIHEQPSSAAPMGNRTLVIVQMAGGNDGLNTIVAHNDDKYYDLRGMLAIQPNDVLPIDREVGFHPSLSSLKELWDEGVLGVVEGVGYPKQNFSHFYSMDIWQTADLGRRGFEGWLGRYLEGIAGEQDAFHSLVIDNKLPKALFTNKVSVPLVQSVEKYSLGSDAYLSGHAKSKRTQALLDLYSSSGSAPFSAVLDKTFGSALTSTEQIKKAHEAYVPAVDYGDTKLAQRLRIVAEAIDANIGLRVAHVRIGGFDTHASQIPEHADLLTRTADAIKLFYRDLQAHGNDQDVVIMTWSEFGRRVKANASGGTDHGSAGPMFLAGSPVAGGFYGQRSNLNDLQKNNLKFTTDFRQVYASVLEGWLGAPAEIVLGGRFESLPMFKAAAVAA